MRKKSTHESSPMVLAGIPEDVTHVPRLTIKKLADRLAKIEKEHGYETALLGVEHLDYVEICRLTEQKHADNDPLLMPSRFMLLYGATDEGLEGKGNLDTFPYELNKDAMEDLSVERLARYLGTLGWYDGPWHKSEDQGSDDEEIGEMDPLELVGDLFGALCAYIQHAPEPHTQELQDETHTVVKGQCLSEIAAIHGIRDWRLLWELNKDTLGDNWDLIRVGDVLKLPDTTKNPLVEWFRENQWDEYLTDKGYQYPGKYLSLTLLDANDAVLEFKEPVRCQVYRYAPTPLLLHEIELASGDDLDVLVPDIEHLAVWVDGVAIGFHGRRWPSYEEFLKEPEGGSEMSGLASRQLREPPLREIEVDKGWDDPQSAGIPGLHDLKDRVDAAKAAISRVAGKISNFKLP
ncbi:MAG: LysM peptidoglycan-binding domain-containing protein [Fibrobacteria bacterium]|nr:LysM peptidoglycan-binding domain-containing protein [Fibrobacteria bacterium]